MMESVSKMGRMSEIERVSEKERMSEMVRASEMERTSKIERVSETEMSAGRQDEGERDEEVKREAKRGVGEGEREKCVGEALATVQCHVYKWVLFLVPTRLLIVQHFALSLALSLAPFSSVPH